jgi:hypothetical protein
MEPNVGLYDWQPHSRHLRSLFFTSSVGYSRRTGWRPNSCCLFKKFGWGMHYSLPSEGPLTFRTYPINNQVTQFSVASFAGVLECLSCRRPRAKSYWRTYRNDFPTNWSGQSLDPATPHFSAIGVWIHLNYHNRLTQFCVQRHSTLERCTWRTCRKVWKFCNTFWTFWYEIDTIT